MAAVHFLAWNSRHKNDAYCRFVKGAKTTTDPNEVTCTHCLKKLKGIPNLGRLEN